MIRALVAFLYIMWQPVLMVFACLILAALLSACATTSTIPPQLLSCAAQPPAPVSGTQRDVGLYIVDLAAAGDDCRTKINTIRGLQE
ncbi:hypothetical protein [Pelagibacterium sp.]|uniref:Rz1-like lysis system protein LysC n=1 Tax=Pelagibacterium sp. TaxID=1967288 RepID=UPI003A8DA493